MALILIAIVVVGGSVGVVLERQKTLNRQSCQSDNSHEQAKEMIDTLDHSTATYASSSKVLLGETTEGGAQHSEKEITLKRH